tara:strand:- start:457 stop:1404 length:948 start_codon:yes stop_codon:yes gene_type:complete
MGILRSPQREYYNIDGSHGNYRLVELQEIIDSFNATYVGKGKLCEGVVLNDITFHALRAMQELSYDTLRATKDWEVKIPSTLVLVMPVDYVNYIKLSWSDGNGIQRIIYPTSKTSNPLNVSTDTDPEVETWGGWTTDGTNTDLDFAGDTNGTVETSDTNTSYQSNTSSDMGSVDADNMKDSYGDLAGTRYGIDPQYAQANGSFFVDESAGKFHFSSNIAGKTVVLNYISDGVVTNAGNTAINLSATHVPKLAEEAIYKHILYGVLLARKDSPPGLLAQIKKERFAETRKAKLRLSNIKIEELTQILRGQSKIIKH